MRGGEEEDRDNAQKVTDTDTDRRLEETDRDTRRAGGGPIEVKEELVPGLYTLPMTVKEESRISTPPPVINSIEGNAEPQHSTIKQPDVSTSVMCDGSVHPPLRPVQTNKEASIAHEPECCEPIQIAPHSKISQANSESSTSQEPQCLGPFVEPSSIKCSKCSVVLSEYYQLLSHSCIAKHLSRESRKKKLKCYFCEKEYGTMSALKKHIKTYVEKTYVQCSICGMRLNREISFKEHALIHTNQWPYRCHICGHGARSQRYLERHKTIHTEKSWMCDVCGAMFHNQIRLNTHKIVHSERKYECDLCFAKFKGRCQLKRHKKNMHSVREKFQCEDCSLAFTSKHQLKYHKEVKHDDNSSGERFICSVCNKEFKRRFAFNKHMNKHTRIYENGFQPQKCLVTYHMYVHQISSLVRVRRTQLYAAWFDSLCTHNWGPGRNPTFSKNIRTDQHLSADDLELPTLYVGVGSLELIEMGPQ
ncbi:zinc finger protein 728-like [Schistocerca serialis cubense]|uniref:zinc finger protein 728-like n=1 Tax=Schistocerca serialis cubense TaxID=2023355 RepID=UPI00214E48B4|nr:zinc finger protein 728-like [Schistocerca serialis cubense]